MKNENRNFNIVRLLVENGSKIDDLNSEGKTILVKLLEKEELNDQKLDKVNREEKGKLDLNIEDEKIRTYLQNIKVKNLGIDLSKELSKEDTKKLEGILYTLKDKDKYPDGKYDFTLEVDFNTKLNYPEELHYPKDLDEKHIQPYMTGDKILSHEPYFLKYKDMHQDKLVLLKKIIQLTKWDNQKTEDEKVKIIDDIMTGKISMDSYKYQVFHENGITQEQHHLLDHIDEDSLFEYQKENHNQKIVKIKSKRTVDEEGTIKNTPFDIDYGTERELKEKEIISSLDQVINDTQRLDYEKLLQSSNVPEKEKKSILQIIQELLRKININMENKHILEIEKLKNKLLGKTKEVKEIEKQNIKNKIENKKFLLTLGIILSLVVIVIFIYLLKKKKIKVDVVETIKRYGG